MEKESVEKESKKKSVSCVECHILHKKCTEKRPCPSCLKRNRPCIARERKPREKKRKTEDYTPCPSCSHPLVEGAFFCHVCGSKQAQKMNVNQKLEQENESLKQRIAKLEAMVDMISIEPTTYEDTHWMILSFPKFDYENKKQVSLPQEFNLMKMSSHLKQLLGHSLAEGQTVEQIFYSDENLSNNFYLPDPKAFEGREEYQVFKSYNVFIAKNNVLIGSERSE